MKKKTLCYLICILFLFSLTGCADSPAPASMQENGTTAPTDNQTSNSTPEPPIDANLEPPVDAQIYFNSMNEIKTFFSEKNANQPNGSTELVDKNIFQYATQSDAVKFTNTANSVQYPIADAERGLSYHVTGPDGPCLNIIYIVNGIQYSFAYFYNCHSPIDYEGEADYPNVQIGPYAIDLFRIDSNNPYLIGNTLINGFVATIRIKGNEGMENFDFSAFDFVSLNDIAENVTA